MTKQNAIIDVLKEMLVEATKTKLKVADIKDDADVFRDCGADSTSIVDLVIAIENRFNITILEEELEIRLFEKLSNLASFIEARVTENDRSEDIRVG